MVISFSDDDTQLNKRVFTFIGRDDKLICRLLRAVFENQVIVITVITDAFLYGNLSIFFKCLFQAIGIVVFL